MDSITPISSQAALSTLTNSSTEKTSTSQTQSVAEFSANSDAVIFNASLGSKINGGGTSSSPDFQELYKSLSITGKEIVDKINEQLKTTLPNGVQSLKLEEVTPDATAGRIVSGVTAFFDQYAKQHKDLSGDALVDSFISEVKKGVDQGYGDAVKILDGTGAFKVDGVKDGVEQTRSLIDDKLAAFAEQKKKELTPPSIDAAPATKNAVLELAGSATIKAVA